MEKEREESIEQLQARIREQDKEIQALRQQVSCLKGESSDDDESDTNDESNNDTSDSQLLSAQQIERYSRQLLLKDGFGVQGQRKLLSSSVLVIGAGGIGSTGIKSCET